VEAQRLQKPLRSKYAFFLQKADKLNEALMMSAVTQQTPIEEGYLIGSEDVLEIEAYNVDELKKPYESTLRERLHCP